MDEIAIRPGVIASRDYGLYLEREKTLVVADLHLGYEAALRAQGVSLPRFQKQHMVERLGNLVERYSPETLVVNGDFKHEFSRNLTQEWQDVLDVLDFLEGKAEVVLVRGNHDNYLKTILSSRRRALQPFHQAGPYTVVHGHEAFLPEGPLILGHEHPSLRLKDTIGAAVSVPCFAATREVVLLPAFSPLAYGSDVLHGPYLSPLLKPQAMRRARVYGLDEKLGILDFGRAEELLRRPE